MYRWYESAGALLMDGGKAAELVEKIGGPGLDLVDKSVVRRLSAP
jgi:hypothetical protein